MLMFVSTHRKILADKHAELREEREERRRLGRLVGTKVAEKAEFQRECDALRAQLQPFLDRQEKAKQNLRQFQAKESV